MREILWRGKRLCDGMWVYGDLVRNHDAGWVMINTYNPDGADIAEIVAEESVGQYSGITDKNYQRLFEDDIFRKGEDTYLIEVKDYTFYWRKLYDGYRHRNVFDKNVRSWLSRADSLIMEKIGNIFDNPELLERK